MKLNFRLLTLGFGLLLQLVCSSSAGTLEIPVRNFTSGEITNRRVLVKLQNPGAVVAGPWAIAGDSVTKYSGTNGIAYFSNILAGDYSYTIYGSPERSGVFTFPDTTNLVNIAELTGTNSTPSYYTAAQINALLAAIGAGGGSGYQTNFTGVGTNQTFRAFGAPSTKALDVYDIAGLNQFYIDDEGLHAPYLTNTTGDGYLVSIGTSPDGKLARFIGPISNDTTGNAATANSVTNGFAVRVASKGITNGLSSVLNDGCNFGPDTPGTTTSGLQEALNSFPRGTNYGPYMSFAKLKLPSGNFFFTNVLDYTNQFTTSVEIEGEGMLNTTLIYAGNATGTNIITIQGGTNRAAVLNLPIHFKLSNITLTSLTQTTNTLLLVTNYSYAEIDHVNFTGWNVRTNQDSGSAVSMYPLAQEPPGLVGLVLASPVTEHSTVVSDCFFAGLADGMYARCDHLSARNLRFALISYWAGDSTNKNLWPSNSIYSLGSAIIQSSGYDSTYNYCHFYAAKNSHVGVNLDHSPTFIGCHWEAGVDLLSDNMFFPTLIQPVATGATMDAFSGFVLKSPTGLSNASVNWSTNYYLKTAIDHPNSGGFGRWPYPSSFTDFYVNRANTNVFVVYAGIGAFADAYFPLTGAKFAINADGSASFQDGVTTGYANGSWDFIGGIHFDSGGVATLPTVIAANSAINLSGSTNYNRPYAVLYSQNDYSADDNVNQKILTNYVSAESVGGGFATSVATGSITNTQALRVTVSFHGSFLAADVRDIYVYTNGVATLLGLRNIGIDGVQFPVAFSGSLNLPANTRISVGVTGGDSSWASRTLTVSQ